eukprot:m.128783 g.128783  ORF g.128783 m.128783 type:complete len:980 (+) comp16747_c0_seq1:239-3178(+)
MLRGGDPAWGQEGRLPPRTQDISKPEQQPSKQQPQTPKSTSLTQMQKNASSASTRRKRSLPVPPPARHASNTTMAAACTPTHGPSNNPTQNTQLQRQPAILRKRAPLAPGSPLRSKGPAAAAGGSGSGADVTNTISSAPKASKPNVGQASVPTSTPTLVASTESLEHQEQREQEQREEQTERENEPRHQQHSHQPHPHSHSHSQSQPQPQPRQHTNHQPQPQQLPARPPATALPPLSARLSVDNGRASAPALMNGGMLRACTEHDDDSSVPGLSFFDSAAATACATAATPNKGSSPGLVLTALVAAARASDQPGYGATAGRGGGATKDGVGARSSSASAIAVAHAPLVRLFSDVHDHAEAHGNVAPTSPLSSSSRGSLGNAATETAAADHSPDALRRNGSAQGWSKEESYIVLPPETPVHSVTSPQGGPMAQAVHTPATVVRANTTGALPTGLPSAATAVAATAGTPAAVSVAQPKDGTVMPAARCDQEAASNTGTSASANNGSTESAGSQSPCSTVTNAAIAAGLIARSSSDQITLVMPENSRWYDQEVQRLRIAQEIQKTEHTYVQCLKTIREVFAQPLLQEGAISEKEAANLFSAELNPLIGMHEDLLHRINERMTSWKWQGLLGDIFARFCGNYNTGFVQAYTSYVNHFPHAVSAFRKLSQRQKFSDAMARQLADPRCEGLDLSAYLLTPIQRLPRYVLLLKTLLSHTSEDHPDHYYIELALDKMKGVMLFLNDSFEQSAKLASELCNYKRQGVRRRRRRLRKSNDEALKPSVSVSSLSQMSDDDSSSFRRSFGREMLPAFLQRSRDRDSRVCSADVSANEETDHDTTIVPRDDANKSIDEQLKAVSDPQLAKAANDDQSSSNLERVSETMGASEPCMHRGRLGSDSTAAAWGHKKLEAIRKRWGSKNRLLSRSAAKLIGGPVRIQISAPQDFHHVAHGAPGVKPTKEKQAELGTRTIVDIDDTAREGCMQVSMC